MTWAYSIIGRPDGKYRLRQQSGQASRYDTDHGDYATLADAQKAMDRLIKPQVFYYDAHGNALDV